jgi:tRNA threonylcarbamoyl adenosine modification protein (Sua5/YciO/YrdC/YwlC family)
MEKVSGWWSIREHKIFADMSKLIKMYNENPDPRAIQTVVEVLRQGGLIIYPTDTVYGLGCDITDSRALERIARIKKVKLDKANFSFICYDLSNLSTYVRQIDTPVYKLLKRALPGPYTFVLNGSNKLPKDFKKKKTVGIRVPDNNIIRSIVKELGNPIVSTSIYDEDEVIEYTTDPELIFEKWRNLVDLVIDGGYGGNVPSTIIDVSGDEIKVIREGKGSLDLL